MARYQPIAVKERTAVALRLITPQEKADDASDL